MLSAFFYYGVVASLEVLALHWCSGASRSLEVNEVSDDSSCFASNQTFVQTPCGPLPQGADVQTPIPPPNLGGGRESYTNCTS